MSEVSLSAPAPLGASHDVSAFSCGQDALDDWLRKRALKNEAIGASRTYVVCKGKIVVAYYALAVGSVGHEISPGAIRRNMPNPIPAMILARLAVDEQCKGRGLGAALVRDALLRTVQAAHLAGIRTMLAHALNQGAADFYCSLGFMPSPFEPLVLFLPLSHLSIRETSG